MAIKLSHDGWRRALLASIHDVSPLYWDETEKLRDILTEYVDPCRIALLVIPDHWQQARIRAGTPFATRLREWADQGSEVFLHGWCHLDCSREKRVGERLLGGFLTANEGEFLSLEHDRALQLIRDGRALLEDITGHEITGFVAPAWLYSNGAHQAVSELQFALCENHFSVWDPRDGRQLTRGPVVTWASRNWVRALSSVGFAKLARLALDHAGVVRAAVHPEDLSRPELCRSIKTTFRHFARNRTAIRYSDLLTRCIEPPSHARTRAA